MVSVLASSAVYRWIEPGSVKLEMDYIIGTAVSALLMDELRCRGRVNSTCSTNGTCHVQNPVLRNEQGKKVRLSLRQTEHVRDHLRHRYSVTVNKAKMATVKCPK
jgi:hypothetical protein